MGIALQQLGRQVYSSYAILSAYTGSIFPITHAMLIFINMVCVPVFSVTNSVNKHLLSMGPVPDTSPFSPLS